MFRVECAEGRKRIDKTKMRFLRSAHSAIIPRTGINAELKQALIAYECETPVLFLVVLPLFNCAIMVVFYFYFP